MWWGREQSVTVTREASKNSFTKKNGGEKRCTGLSFREGDRRRECTVPGTQFPLSRWTRGRCIDATTLDNGLRDSHNNEVLELVMLGKDRAIAF